MATPWHSALVFDLAALYRARYQDSGEDRLRVWRVLLDEVFQPLVPEGGAVLDVGCGWGEFINQVRAARRFAIDLNPDARGRLSPEVTFFQQSCADPWPLPDGSLDLVFTSNFLEHLPSKVALVATVREAWRCLRPGGRLVCVGPNVRYVPGAYWDFFDHHLPLTDRSLAECLTTNGFALERQVARFLPYTMAGRRPPPSALIRAYLSLPLAWPLLGKQFLVVARRT